MVESFTKSPTERILVSAANPFPQTDFSTEVALGRVPGTTNKIISADSGDQGIGPVTTEVWGGPAAFVFNYAGTGETWEVVSSSPDDKAGGPGVGKILLPYIDNNFVEQSQEIVVTGTTPNAISGSDKLFPDDMKTIEVDSGGKALGDITVRKVGNGDVRAVMMEGTNVSRDGFALVPAGETWFLTGIVPNTGKGGDIDFQIEVTTGQDGIWLEIPMIQAYQNTPNILLTSKPIIEKSYIRILGTSSNPQTHGIALLVFMRVENDN